MPHLPDKLYTAAQVREIDRIAIEQQGIAGIELMRKAGMAVFENIRQQWPEKYHVTVFCGAGNNAGDGYVIATLVLKAGFSIEVISLVDEHRLRGDALTALQDFVKIGGVVKPFLKHSQLPQTLIVDALLGTGLDRNVSGDYAEAIQLINDSTNTVIAVDLPSGLNADTGQPMGCAVKADMTVTLIALKQGLFSGEAAEHCGIIHHASLDIPAKIFSAIKPSARLINEKKLPLRHRCTHKGQNGHVLLIGGDTGYSGAIRLAAEAALRSGAGLVSVATRAVHSQLINLGRPEIMSHPVETQQQLQRLLGKANVIAIGPGLGQSTWGRKMLEKTLEASKDYVIDADALNLLAKRPVQYSRWVLTPHPGEAARLLACSTADIAKDRFCAVSKLQQQYGGVCLLKGAGTLIKTDNDLSVSITGNPGMGSGGMGDLLTGMIAGLLAQGMNLESAAQQAVYQHGHAADIAVELDGERGLLASDLLPLIRKLLN